ncbi:MAG: PAS domain-containing protein [Firmicutes bacterium]|mgnify:CR=1 FL=1|nr:PAS domain-containing protein [Bacillota bacterium]
MWFGGGIIISGLFSEEAVAILNFLPDPLFIIDQGQQVLWSNRQAGDIFGSDTGGNETLAGVTGIEKIERLAGQVLQSGSPLEFSFEDTTVKIKRQEKHYFFRIAIIPANYNRLQGAIVLFTDVTRFQEMEKIKSDFVSIVSHEFRTPLTTIIVGVEMLLEGMLGNLTPRGKEILEAIEGDCQRLSRLIDNLLQLSRVEAGAILIEAEPVDVTNLVQEAVRPLKIQARDKEVELLVELPPDPPPVETDFNKSVWVLTNLIGNALRYTDPGGTITVRLQEKGDYLFLSVRDTGCGIPKSYQEKIFTKYVQVRGQGSSKRGGAGLGLSIARDIVTSLGGEIWVESEEGKGSTFTFTLPVLQPGLRESKGGNTDGS